MPCPIPLGPGHPAKLCVDDQAAMTRIRCRGVVHSDTLWETSTRAEGVSRGWGFAKRTGRGQRSGPQQRLGVPPPRKSELASLPPGGGGWGISRDTA
eukprot:scaffold48316_cov24-Tisochrysis_lutea.AAC.1